MFMHNDVHLSDEELCKRFGTTLEEVERDVQSYEMGDLTGMKFGSVIEGRAKPMMNDTILNIHNFKRLGFCRDSHISGFSVRQKIVREVSDTFSIPKNISLDESRYKRISSKHGMI